MPRRKKVEDTKQEAPAKKTGGKPVFYKVTSKGDKIVTLKHRTVLFDSNSQAIVSEEEFNYLKDMGVIYG